MSVTFCGPNLNAVLNPDPGVLRPLVLDLPEQYWQTGNGGAGIDFVGGETVSRLDIMPSLQLRRIYLQLTEVLPGGPVRSGAVE